MSVMLTCVLLNVARMFAMPTEMFFAPLALTIFLPARSSARSSAAVGAEPAAGVAASEAFGASAVGPAAPAALGGPLRCGLVSSADFATASGFASLLEADFFFVSSAI